MQAGCVAWESGRSTCKKLRLKECHSHISLYITVYHCISLLYIITVYHCVSVFGFYGIVYVLCFRFMNLCCFMYLSIYFRMYVSYHFFIYAFIHVSLYLFIYLSLSLIVYLLINSLFKLFIYFWICLLDLFVQFFL